MLDLALEEKLDELDPLRHLRDDGSDGDASAHIVPAQPPSIRDQTIELSFHASADTNVDTSGTTVSAPVSVTIKLAVDASPGCGGIAWPAGEVLASYIAQKGSLQGRNVLELGSGTGLVGLVAGILGARVWITDQANNLFAILPARPLLGIMKQNVHLNNLESCVSVAELNWSALSTASARGEPLPTSIPKPDLILAADCVYFEPAFPLLVQTLADLVADGSPDVLFCYKKRRKADKRFFTLLKREFIWEDVTDDPRREVYSREALSLLRLKRK
ncbi:putative methyltransferase-domain-containing protein [Daedaleopsis nitida]|nr:putative methyltransferase-domain-containing protein [Daedaleopsis nitida]